MTAVLPEMVERRAARAAAPEPARQAWWVRWRWLLAHRWLQTPLLLGIAACLFYDRFQLCKQYLFKYTDEDQAVMWYAAWDLLRGRIAEPAFYGQDYNTCAEGFLAAPLVAMHVPYNVACPLTSMILGLLPFLLLAFVAWRRGQTLVAATSLLVPLLLPVRYAMITGIPRGFQTGLAVGILPAILLLPPAVRRATGAKLMGKARMPQRSWPALRYFVAAILGVMAFEVGENAVIFLAPVAIYALLTSWREWKFWVFGLAGLVVALPYPIYVYQFYYVYHPDYIVYLRGQEFTWSFANFTSYLNSYIAPRFGESLVLKDLVPGPITGRQAPEFMVIVFALLAGLLLLRARAAALAAAFTGALIVLASFGYNRLWTTTTSANTASFPYSRMLLALPVLFVWLLFFVNHKPWARFANSGALKWAARGTLAGLLVLAVHTMQAREKEMPIAVEREVNASRYTSGYIVCPAIPVEQFYATAREVKKVAEATHADFLLVAGGDRQKHIAYALAPVTGIEAAYPIEWERRARVLLDQYKKPHQAVMLITYPTPPGATVAGGGKTVWLNEDGDPIENVPATTRLHGTEPYSLPKGLKADGLSLMGPTGKKFVQGTDYTVTTVKGEVQIRRTEKGAIPDGDTVRLVWHGVHSITVPPIYVLKAHGQSIYDLPIADLPTVVPPDKRHPYLWLMGEGR